MLMLKIIPISSLSDNYIWLIIHHNECIAVDTGDDTVVIDYLTKNHITLKSIWITHHHDDHIGGVANLVKTYPATQVFAHQAHGIDIKSDNLTLIDKNDKLDTFGFVAQVWHTAGHTDSHLSFVLDVNGQHHVFCGDTLFSAGCGRVFTGTIEQLFYSFQQFNQLADNTFFYPAHEYTLNNLQFAQFIEPNNGDISDHIDHCQRLLNNNQPTLPTTLALEKKINPFLRIINCHKADFKNADAFIDGIYQKTNTKSQPINSHKTDNNNCALTNRALLLFSSLRQLKDNF